MQVHDSGDELRFGPFRFQGADSENNTKSRKYFQTQMRSDQTLRKGYIAKISLQSSGAITKVRDYRGWRSEGWHQLEPTQEVDTRR